MKRRLGRSGILVEVNGRYYLSEERLKQAIIHFLTCLVGNIHNATLLCTQNAKAPALRLQKTQANPQTHKGVRDSAQTGGGVICTPELMAKAPANSLFSQSEVIDWRVKVKPLVDERAVKCPLCGGERVYKDGIRYTRHGEIQRYLCRNCCYRFSC